MLNRIDISYFRSHNFLISILELQENFCTGAVKTHSAILREAYQYFSNFPESLPVKITPSPTIPKRFLRHIAIITKYLTIATNMERCGNFLSVAVSGNADSVVRMVFVCKISTRPLEQRLREQDELTYDITKSNSLPPQIFFKPLETSFARLSTAFLICWRLRHGDRECEPALIYTRWAFERGQ